MNRRKALFGMTVLGGAVTVTSTWYNTEKTPDLISLDVYSDLISELAEMIIPATDTVGAKQAGVGDFIIMMLPLCTRQ